MELEQWNRTIDVNLTSSFLLSKHFLRCLAKEDVSDDVKAKVNIVFVGSSAGRFGEKGHSDYAVSKSGASNGFDLEDFGS
jgi:NAD(P)-dependent dehydrogenase (short-subunit alcohol dehydrogenase family)